MSPAKDTELFRLADSTVVEPLVNGWYAYSHTIAPVPASLHLVHYQLKILESYLAQPARHFKTFQDKKMLGGPFVGIPEQRAEDVRALLESTKSTMGPSIEFARALHDFEALLMGADGTSIEPFYERMPEALRGCCELVYDYQGHPILRVIEALAYRGPGYDRSKQSLLLQEQETDDCRPFFQSTPRLGETSQLKWRVPFDAPAIDDLFGLDQRARPLAEICDLVGVGSAEADVLERMLAPQALDSVSQEPWREPRVRLRYFGHASVLIEVNGLSVLLDPNIPVIPKRPSIERFSYKDLPEKIDYVLLTHSHADHTVVETLLRLRRRVGVVVVPKAHGVFYGDVSLKLLLRAIGYPSVVELDPFDELREPGHSITAVPSLGEHADLCHAKSSYVVKAGGESIFFGADSNCLDAKMYDIVRREVGPIGSVFIGMECSGANLTWQYGPLLRVTPRREVDQSRRLSGCNAKTALRLIDSLKPSRFFVYGMGLEPWLEYLMALALTEDTVQMREVQKALAGAKERGVSTAKCLRGRFELVI